MRRLATLLFLLTIVTAGCEDNPTAPLSSNVSDFSIETALVSVGLEGAPGGETIDRLQAISRAEVDLREILGRSQTWPEADAEFRPAISDAPAMKRWALGQVAALVMFRGYILEGDPTEEKEDMADFYLPFVLEAEAPQVDIVYDVIESYGDDWSRAETRQIAADAAAVGNRYVAHKLNCGEDCQLSPEQLRTIISSPTTDREVLISQVSTAAERLSLVAEE